MFGAPGKECIVTGRTATPPGVAILTDKNSLGLKEGDKVKVVLLGKSYVLEVGARAACNDLRNRDHITIHSDSDAEGRSGQYLKAQDYQMAWKKAWGTRKARLAAVGTAISVAAAAGASINASLKDTCTNLHCVKGITWLLIVVSAAGSIFAWAKDNLS
ncbi:hypothetical protein [Alloacidobacterium sp.]|uniref:hypothetical protein n=1 Tax=Alloacidobacterium sp. TaxID=2951999 RepID=UPI002D562FCC|nr:hypothetical protein [Alloacidobacterium sp.]HYK37726.1 hypothetical protein [Alloacidobacterium sp.]